MARVTVEDCVERIPNRFDLVMLAAQRSRDISSGAPLTLDRDNDKNPVVSLREIADETIDLLVLSESLVQSMQKHIEVDEPEEDNPEFDMPSLPIGEAAEAAGQELVPDALAVDEETPAIEAAALEADAEGDLVVEADDVVGEDPDSDLVGAVEAADDETVKDEDTI